MMVNGIFIVRWLTSRLPNLAHKTDSRVNQRISSRSISSKLPSFIVSPRTARSSLS
jgi:hypothetical protein